MRPEEKLFDAITGIDEELVESAQTYVFHKQTRTWQRAASLAACLLIVASIGFGMLQLAGIGGMGGSDSAANSSGAAPESGGDGVADDALTGDAGGSDTTTGDSAGDEDGGQTAETVFTATVLELGDGYLLVEPVAGDAMLATADRIQVSLDGAVLPDGVAEGAVVEITFDGLIRESYPAQISGVTEIVLIDG